jgi:pimeloyl-ACP methyl ester carboxylesterase
MVEVLVAVSVVYGAFCGILFFGQSKQVYFPDLKVSATPADTGLKFESVRIRTEDGKTLGAWYVPASVGSNLGYTVLYCHGNAGDIGDRVSHVEELHRVGFDVMVFDYRGFGESTGKPTEKGTYLDARACWDHLVKTRGVVPERIVVYGHSLGGAVAAHLAADAPPRLLVVEATFTSAGDMAARMFPWLPSRLLCRFRYDTRDAVRRARCPVIVAHSRDDEMIPYVMGRRLFDSAHGPKRFVELRGGHNESGLGYAPEYPRLIVDAAANGIPVSEGKADP